MNVESPPPNDSKRQQRQGADWTSWAMHLIAGILLGGGFAIVLAFRLIRLHLIDNVGMIPVVFGGALILGAIASHMGDRLWIRRSIFDADAPPRSRASKIASMFIGDAGAIFVALAFATRMTAAVASSRPHQGLGIWALPSVLLPGLLLWWALRTGTAITVYFIIDRIETPFLYWFYVTSYIIGLAAAVWYLW